MRKVLVVLGVAVICLTIATLALWAFFDVNRYRQQVEARLQEKFGREIQLGEMNLSFLPLAFRVHSAVISEDPSFGSATPFAVIDTLYIQPRLLPLLRGSVEISSLQLGSPRLELIRDKNGTWNFADLLVGQPLTLPRLRIDDGQVAITDLFDREPRSVYDHIDLVLYDYAPGKSFPVEASIHMPGAGQQIIAFNGKAGPLQRESLAHTPFEGKLDLREVGVSALQRFLKAEALVNSDAVLTGNGSIRNDGILASKGHMEIRDAQIRGVKLGYPITADYDISSTKSDSATAIHDTTLKLGQTPISVEGSISSATTPAVLDLRLRTSGASIAEIARLAAAFGVAFDASSDVAGRLSLDLHATGSAKSPILDGNLSARNIQVSGGKVREPVEIGAVDLAFTPSLIRSNEFTAKTGRTSVTAQVVIENYATTTPQLRASMNTGNAELGEFVRVARAYGLAGEDEMTGTGSISLNVSFSGPLKQTENWTYSGSGAVSNAKLRLPSLASKPLEVRKADLRFSANSLVINDVTFSIGETTAHGNITAHNLAAPRVEFSLSADRINAAEWHEMAMAGTQKQHATQTSLLARAMGSGQLAAQTVVYDQLVLSNVRSAVRLDQGIITMSPITAGLYNGQEVGTVVVNLRAQPVAYTVNSKLQGIDANQFLSSVSSLKEMLYGVMSASTDGRFSATGGASDIARTLNGKVSLNLAEGRLAHMDLLHQLATIGKFTRTARAVQPFTRLIRLNGDFSIANGMARTNNLEATIEDGSLAADGTVDLVDQKLNLRLTAVLSENYSQNVGGTGIGGLMSTVLSNRRGELVIPIVVTGTLQNPKFAPDLEKVARMKLENLLPTFGNPDKLTTGIFGDVFRTKPGQAPSEPSPGGPRPANPLRDLFEGLFGSSK